MNNGSEMERWLKDAHASLASAENAFQAGDYRVATQNAQLCTELSAKAIIALFAEPAWRHDPGKQLQSLLEKHKQQITQQLDDQTRQNLARLAQDADEVAPWHGWSTYGRGEEDDVWIAAVDLCTQSVAYDLLARARRSVETVAAFIQHTNETSHRRNMERSMDWMDQALGDWEHARHDLQNGFYDWACFSAQQAAEKAVKAVFQKLGAEAWGHSVADLLEELSNTQTVPAELKDIALELDKAYIPTRYPNAHPSGSPRTRYTRVEAERLVTYAEKITQFCSSLLSTL